MKTLAHILADLAAAGLPLSRRHLYRELEGLGIQPVGKRQRPQRYPADSAQRILAARGFEPAAPPLDTAAARLTSMKALRSERRKAKEGR